MKSLELRCKVIITLICMMWVMALQSQEVSISEELTIRNYYSYEMVGEVNNRYIVVRDKGFEKEVDVFNEFMELTLSQELHLENKKTNLVSSYSLDSVFNMFYTYSQEDSITMMRRSYDHKLELKDSSLILKIPKKQLKRSLISLRSENDKVEVFLAPDKDNLLHYFIYDISQQKFIAEKLIDLKLSKNWYRNIKELVLSDDGLLFLLIQNKKTHRDDKVETDLVSINTYTQEAFINKVGQEGVIMRNVHLDYDNTNNKVILCGMYAMKEKKEIDGIYVAKSSMDEMINGVSLELVKFGQDLTEYVSRHKKKKNKVFQDFIVKDVIKRQDGGLVLFLELVKEFSRRNSYGAGSDISAGTARLRGAWVDFYNEDIIVMSIDPSHKVDWTKILYKKQFSQDDDAVFSSYFVMKNPSRIRLIYNDEIKSNSTVSEYILDPGGKLARNSLLSTEYQDIKLRFRDAIQINNNEILVPSETNYSLNLVKISY